MVPVARKNPVLGERSRFFRTPSWPPIESRAVTFDHDEVLESPHGRLGETTRT